MTETQSDRRIALIRTLVPAFIGVLLSKLIAAVPAVAAVLTWCDEVIADAAKSVGAPLVSVSAIGIATAALTALVIAAWYAAGRLLGKRWKQVERWMLGSASRPTYSGKYSTGYADTPTGAATGNPA